MQMLPTSSNPFYATFCVPQNKYEFALAENGRLRDQLVALMGEDLGGLAALETLSIPDKKIAKRRDAISVSGG